ncbi:MAG: helix-turn-helix domain-containing protein [Bacteriovoracaceae bacterium]|jgi:transcriptional regulator with XRE-family HTH domain|nr:helix-turn-helix domain-containing protein [Bacteriovoracaceae bacterium]
MSKKPAKRGIAKGTVLVSPSERKQLQKLGKRIKAERLARGWTLHETEDNGFSNWTHWQYIESGKKNITFTTLMKVANTLGVAASDLLEDI